MKSRIMIAFVIGASFTLPSFAQLKPDTTTMRLPPLIQAVEIVGSRFLSPGADQSMKIGSTATGGMEVTAAVILNSAAGGNGVIINLASSNESVAKPPASVRVEAGTNRERFAFLTTPVSASTTVTITASRALAGDSKSATFTVVPTALIDLTLDNNSVVGGTPVLAHVKFSGPPPASPSVQAKMTSSDPTVASVPYTVALPQQRTVADFSVQTKGTLDKKQVTITATYGSQEQTATFTVQETQLKQIGTTCANGTVCSFSYGAPVPVVLPVFLTGAAPAGGVPVNLSTNDSQTFPVPPSITIPAGEDHASVSVIFPAAATTGSATITASYKGVNKSVSFSLAGTDIKFESVWFVDRYNNTITKAADSQAFSVCAKLRKIIQIGLKNTTLGVGYVTHTGAPTATGREFEVPAVFSDGWYANVCAQLPGLESGQWHDVTLKGDKSNVVPESNETNNTFTAKISR